MKKVLVLIVWIIAISCIVILCARCGNAYVDPKTSTALSQQEQTKLMQEQVKQLKRIADALEKNKNIVQYNGSNKAERSFQIQR